MVEIFIKLGQKKTPLHLLLTLHLKSPTQGSEGKAVGREDEMDEGVEDEDVRLEDEEDEEDAPRRRPSEEDDQA